MGAALHAVERARGNAEQGGGLRVGQVPGFHEREKRFEGDCRQARSIALVRKGLRANCAQVILSCFNDGGRHSRLLTRRYASFDAMSSNLMFRSGATRPFDPRIYDCLPSKTHTSPLRSPVLRPKGP